ncbi:MAG: dynamin family protein [Abditibacteriales bacterium]|nr:dynamin family protein [Abditibacteriales bacterium]MDW8364274.1 dynamin family protein [Abditibacteriales bacterium]
MVLDEREALEYYNQIRAKGAGAIRELAAFAEARGAMVEADGEVVPRARLLRELADELEHKAFTIAVVGEFSRGKSTLLNALLGRPNLLPTAIMPSTATITVIHYSEREYARVEYRDGVVRENVPLSDLGQYVIGSGLDGKDAATRAARQMRSLKSEKDVERLSFEQMGKEVAKQLAAANATSQVKRVDVFCNSPFLEGGICLVDTPGIGSVNPEHGEATRAFIHKADAVIFLINTDPVISATECNFLTFLQDHVSNFVFAITKIDRYSDEEREQSIAYTTQTIRDYAGIAEPRIYPVSARLYIEGLQSHDPALMDASGFPEFIEGLDTYLIRERGKLILQNAVRAVKPHFEDLKKAVQMELQSVHLSAEELARKLKETRPALEEAQQVQKAIVEMIDKEIANVEPLLHEGVDWLRCTVGLRTMVFVEIDRYDWQELQHANEQLPIFVRHVMSELLSNTLNRAVRRLTNFRQEIIDWCIEMMDKLDQDLPFDLSQYRDTMEWEFTFDFDSVAFMENLKKVGTIAIGSTLALTLASIFLFGGIGAVVMVGGLLAGTGVTGILKERIRKQLKEELAEPLEKLGQRMLDDLAREIVQNLTDFRRDVIRALGGAISNVSETIQQLESALQSREFNSAERKRQLEEQLQFLNDINDALFETRFWAGYARGAAAAVH